MEPVENKTFGAGAVVFMDERYFIRCRFDGCMLVYAGGDYGWMECTFGTVQISFTGAADRVIGFARHLGVIGQPTQQPSPTGIPGSSKGEH